ncbi:hypothetical protein K6119_11430 [Paracrocinitomix mangrovi]|uniref:hypothetical protein n=1 Tax=Paracrocinitomix mangrovi TaxID=2862509 RepID=UPI001C8F1D00|nr:hypothetical protein [Paracrocinitomix mangrovi]UKN00346.1 hypothetical protein K6119_11430 [Paracrocinitomix mangrovi]
MRKVFKIGVSTAIIFLVTTCSKEESFENNIDNLNTSDPIKIIDSPNARFDFDYYDIIRDDSVQVSLRTNFLGDNKHELIADIQMFGGGYMLSANEKEYPYGATYFKLDKNSYIQFQGDVKENPTAVLKYEDGIEPYKIQKEHVVLTQFFKIQDNTDFIVSGELFFVYEPMCSPNNIYFDLIQKNGQLQLNETKKVLPRKETPYKEL